MSLRRVDFDNPAVANATNPSSSGYHYGSIPNKNANWVPARQATARAAGARPPAVTKEDNDVPMCGINIMVCDIDVNGGQMCGITCSNQPSLRRHIRTAHPGALVNPTRNNSTQAETIDGQNAIKLWVLSGGWRNARYLKEPGAPEGSLVTKYANACEAIARNDVQFASQFGRHFYRRVGLDYA